MKAREVGKLLRDQRELEQKGRWTDEGTDQGNPRDGAPAEPRAAEKPAGPVVGGRAAAASVWPSTSPPCSCGCRSRRGTLSAADVVSRRALGWREAVVRAGMPPWVRWCRLR